jgi:hypothetical protein
MKQHKWHKEIKAWADGAEIESRYIVDVEFKELKEWGNDCSPFFDDEDKEYRIKPQHTFKAMCEIPYKHWVLRFYQMPNDLWYSEGMDDSWMKEMVEASKPQPKENLCKHGLQRGKCTLGEKDCNEPQYLKVYGWLENGNISFDKNMGYPYIGKIKLEVDVHD